MSGDEKNGSLLTSNVWVGGNTYQHGHDKEAGRDFLGEGAAKLGFFGGDKAYLV